MSHNKQPQAIGWITEDCDSVKSATTYDPKVAERWREKGWVYDGIMTERREAA